MANLTPVSGNQLPQEPTTKERVGRFIARTAVISLAALAIFAIIAVSIPSAGAPAWLIGSALFFESLAAPSILGFVISVKAVVYCLAGLAILVAGWGCVGLVVATSKPMDDSAEFEEVEARPSSRSTPKKEAKWKRQEETQQAELLATQRNQAAEELRKRKRDQYLFAFSDAYLNDPKTGQLNWFKTKRFMRDMCVHGLNASEIQHYRTLLNEAPLPQEVFPSADDLRTYDRIVPDKSPLPALNRPEFTNPRPVTPFHSTGPKGFGYLRGLCIGSGSTK